MRHEGMVAWNAALAKYMYLAQPNTEFAQVALVLAWVPGNKSRCGGDQVLSVVAS